MTISDIRFRNENELVILQVLTYESNYGSLGTSKWRDAKTEDLLDVASVIRDLGRRDTPVQDPMNWSKP